MIVAMIQVLSHLIIPPLHLSSTMQMYHVKTFPIRCTNKTDDDDDDAIAITAYFFKDAFNIPTDH